MALISTWKQLTHGPVGNAAGYLDLPTSVDSSVLKIKKAPGRQQLVMKPANKGYAQHAYVRKYPGSLPGPSEQAGQAGCDWDHVTCGNGSLL